MRDEAGSALEPKGLEQGMRDMLTGFEMMALHGRALLAQPDFSLSLLPTLPGDQAVLRQHVSEYDSSMLLGGGLLSAFQEARSAAGHIVNMAKSLEPVALRLDAGPDANPDFKEDLETFQSAMQELSRITTSLDPNDRSAAQAIFQVRAALDDYRIDRIDEDVARFRTGVQQAKYSGTIEALEAQIAGLVKEMNDLNAEIAEGATSQIPSALAFGFSIGKAAATSAVDGKLIVGIAFAIKGEVEKADAFEKQFMAKNATLHSKIEAYKGLIEALIGDQQQMAVLLTITEHVAIYGKNLSAAIAGVDAVLASFGKLKNGFTRLSLIDGPQAPEFFTHQMHDTVASWLTIESLANDALQLARGT